MRSKVFVYFKMVLLRSFLFFIFVPFCGCAHNKPEEKASYGDSNYTASNFFCDKYIGLSNSITLAEDVCFYDGNLYIKAYEGYTPVPRILSVNIENGMEEAFLDLSNGENEISRNICCFCITQEKQLNLIYRELDIDRQSDEYFLSKIDPYGEELGLIRIQNCPFKLEEGTAPVQMVYDSTNELFICASNHLIYLVNPEDAAVQSISMEDAESTHMLLLVDGKVFVFGSSADGERWLREFSPKERSFGEKISLPDNTIGIGCTDISGSVVIYSPENISLLDLRKKETYALCKWASVTISGNNVSHVGYFDSEIIVILNDYSGNGSEMIILSNKGNDNRTEEPVHLKCATLANNGKLVGTVNSFNRAQDEYFIDVVSYVDGDESDKTVINDAINRMMLDMAGANAPDIVDITYFINDSSGEMTPGVDTLLRKGYILDLTPYIEKSSTVTLDDYDKNTLEICSYEGKIAAIPRCIYIYSLITDSSYIKGSEWSVSDLIQLDNSNPEELVENCGWETILELCLYHNLDYFIDRECGKCCFECDEFREIMEYAAQYGDEEGTYNYYRDSGSIKIIWTDQVEAVQYLSNLNYGGRTVFVGFPGIGGDSTSEIGLSPNSCAFAMCGKTGNQDGAWKFIEYYLNSEFFKPITDAFSMQSIDGIPSNKKVLEDYIGYLSSENGPLSHGRMYNNEVYYDRYPLKESEAETLYRIIGQSKPVLARDRVIRRIIEEEVPPYFAGQKELDEVISVIQSRVQLYLDENM